jgi:hypothetical protein
MADDSLALTLHQFDDLFATAFKVALAPILNAVETRMLRAENMMAMAQEKDAELRTKIDGAKLDVLGSAKGMCIGVATTPFEADVSLSASKRTVARRSRRKDLQKRSQYTRCQLLSCLALSHSQKIASIGESCEWIDFQGNSGNPGDLSGWGPSLLPQSGEMSGAHVDKMQVEVVGHAVTDDRGTSVHCLDPNAPAFLPDVDWNSFCFKIEADDIHSERDCFEESGILEAKSAAVIIDDVPAVVSKMAIDEGSSVTSTLNANAVEFMPPPHVRDQVDMDGFWDDLGALYEPLPRRYWSVYETIDWEQCNIRAAVVLRTAFSTPCKCGASPGTSKKCICNLVYCETCYRLASDCACDAPLFAKKSCNVCGYLEHVTLLDEVGDGKGDDLAGAICAHCEDGLIMIDIHYVDSLDCCGHCGRFNDQDHIFPCDGRECLSGDDSMFHHSCMKYVAHPAYPDGAHICRQCEVAHVEVYVDSEGSEEEAPDDDTDEEP